MRLLFVYYAFEDQGSGLVIQGYSRAAVALGHEVLVYGHPRPRIPLKFTMDIASADAILFIFEWTTYLRYGDQLDLLRLVAEVPRERRVILDGDGKYNDVVMTGGDYNHRDNDASRRWIDLCDSLSDKICQPTLHPLRGNVRPFLFYAYDPAWERPLDFARKEYGMTYVGHSKFRWPPMQRLLRAVEPIRDRVGAIALVGDGWGSLPWWAAPMGIEDYYRTDSSYLSSLGIEVLRPVPFAQVIERMSKAVFNPVLVRPTFEFMRLVNPRMFETVAASTIPLFSLDETHAKEIYGERATDLLLREDATDRILDVVSSPDSYAEAVQEIREQLAEYHSHTARIRQLIEIIEG